MNVYIVFCHEFIKGERWTTYDEASVGEAIATVRTSRKKAQKFIYSAVKENADRRYEYRIERHQLE